MNTSRKTALAGLVLAGTLALAGCGDTESPASSPKPDESGMMSEDAMMSSSPSPSDAMMEDDKMSESTEP